MHEVLIDCDLGLGMLKKDGKYLCPADIDDAYAIIDAIHTSEIKVAGITTVFGNTDLESANEALEGLLDRVKDSRISWQSGAVRASSHGNRCPPGAASAADFLAKSLEESPKKIIAIGPLTNIACLTERHPNSISKIISLLIVMGRSPGVEFHLQGKDVWDANFERDPHAVGTILETRIPMILFPFELTKHSLVTTNQVLRFRDSGDLGAYVYRNSIDYLKLWKTQFEEDGFHPWDAAPVAHLKNPSLFLCETRDLSLVMGEPPLLVAQRSLLLSMNETTSAHISHTFCFAFADKDASKEMSRLHLDYGIRS